MYIWRIRPLREQLATEGMPDRKAFHYYLATSILSAMIYEAAANGPPSEFKPVDVLDLVMYFGFTIGGIVWCYRQNGGADGREFLNRVVPIGWVMWWRLVSLVIPLWVALGVAEYIETGQIGRPGAEMTFLVMLMNILFGGMWWRMGVHMKWVKENYSEN